MNIRSASLLKPAAAALCLCLASAAGARAIESATSKDAGVAPGVTAGGDSWDSIITPDGRYVVFASTADNLVLSSSNSPYAARLPAPNNVFLRDRVAGKTTLLSVAFNGTEMGDDDSWPVAISTNGQFILFESSADNLVPGDTNRAADIFLRDVAAGITRLVSVSTNGGWANGASRNAVMTPDGRFVAFASLANNLTLNDTNGVSDVFVRDMASNITTRASSGAVPVLSFGKLTPFDNPQITPDGRFVTFVGSVYNGSLLLNEVYACDLQAGTTVPVSPNAQAVLSGNFSSGNHEISDDGQFVVWESTLSSSPSNNFIFRYNQISSALDLVCSNAAPATGNMQSLDMTPDGRFVTFAANTNTLTAVVTNFGTFTYTNFVTTPLAQAVFLWDGQSDETTFASAGMNQSIPTNSFSKLPVISADGRYVSFLSTATNLTADPVSDNFHLYVRDTQARSTRLVDINRAGAGTTIVPVSEPNITPDGRFITFDSADPDLVAEDLNRASDVFVRDLGSNTAELVSPRDFALPSASPNGDSGSSYGMTALSADGRYVAFVSKAADLVANDTNGVADVFLRDLESGTNIMISANPNGPVPGTRVSSNPYISSDGRYVAFQSAADNLVPGATNHVQQIYIRDTVSGAIALVTIGVDGISPGDGDSILDAMSSDGRYVLIETTAQNLASGLSGTSLKLLFRDVTAETTSVINVLPGPNPYDWYYALMSPDGRYVAFQDALAQSSFNVWDSQQETNIFTLTSSYLFPLAMSPDDRHLAYYAYPSFGETYLMVADFIAKTNLVIVTGNHITGNEQFSANGRFLLYDTEVSNVGADTNKFQDVYLYDFLAATNILISRGFNSGFAANAPSIWPVMSPNGRFIAYISRATNIVPTVTNGFAQLYLYDRDTDTTFSLNLSSSPNAFDHRSSGPVFSADSQTLLFRSWAPDIVPLDFNQSADLFSLRLATTNPTPVFSGQIILAPNSGQPPTLTWPAVVGNNYQVEFKDDLSDPVWLPLSGSVSIGGGWGYATDLTPNASHRFYRIRAF